MTKEERLELRPDQIGDLAFAMAHPRSLNLSDPGTGKTPTACLLMYWLWDAKKSRTFWVMPSSLMKKNRDELLRWSKFCPEQVVIYEGTPDRRAKMRHANAAVWIMTFNMFAKEWELLKGQHPDFNAVVVDEFHMGFKGHKSQRTEELYKCMKECEWFYAMTGTLIDGRLDTAYPAIHIIEPRYYGTHDQFLAFHGEFDFDGKICGWRNHWKLAEIFRRHAVRHTFEEIYGKNEVVIQKELCEMSPRQREVYDKFHADAMLELEDRFLDGTEPGVAVIRARQIMAHPECVKLPVAWEVNGKVKEWKVYDLVEGERTGKDERLLVHLADHERTKAPLIIYASLVPEQERIYRLCEKLGLKAGLINGDTPSRKRAEIDCLFRKGDIQVVVGSQACMAVGYNWGHVDHIIHVSLDYLDSSFIQANRRAERGQRTKPLWITVLEYENSVDQRIFQIVEWKAKNANMVDESRQVLQLTGGGV